MKQYDETIISFILIKYQSASGFINIHLGSKSERSGAAVAIYIFPISKRLFSRQILKKTKGNLSWSRRNHLDQDELDQDFSKSAREKMPIA